MPDDPQSTQGASPGGNSPEAEARIAAMKEKIAALKAAQAAGGAPPAAAAPKPAPAAGGGTAAAVAPAPKPAAAAKPAAPKGPSKPTPLVTTKAPQNETEQGVWYFGRRNFLQSIGWMSFFGFFTIMLLGTLRAMFPRVIYERPPVFKAGFPGDYVPGAVSEKYKDEERVWIIRQGDGSFIALLAICTHLGCTPRWLTAENKFKCPCHGSGFRGTPDWGVNFEGPAPRPLERVGIHMAPDGQIEVDKSQKFLWEKGQWDNPAATLNV